MKAIIEKILSILFPYRPLTSFERLVLITVERVK